MVLLIDIFSINRIQGYENPSLDIIVIELCSTRGFPLEEAREHFSHNQSVISGVILILFQCYCGVVLVILLFICHFYHFISILHTFYIWNITSGIRSLSSPKIVGYFFFRLETYSNVFKPQISVVTHINPQLRDSYT
jgi:hypothetical protein